MKVSELEGAKLDLWVARAAELPGAKIAGGECWIVAPACAGNPGSESVLPFAPSAIWDQGGPIIQKLEINVMFEIDSAADAHAGTWIAFIHPLEESTFSGKDPLVAAMRAAVHSKFGDEVQDD